jgi:nonsense-mediated mRNA decay protein 3
MFCVECGKEGPIYKDGVCANCYIKTNRFTKGPDLIDLSICSHCDSFKVKNTWTSDLFSDVIRRLVINTFQISNDLKKIVIETECIEKKQGMECRVVISGVLDDKEITEEHNLLVRLKKTVCDVCSKKFGGYHEAVIQIRADKRILSEDELYNIRQSVERLVENMQAKGNRSLFITDIEMEHGGLDFYLSEKGASLAIAKKIQERYGGLIKQSSKNIGMNDSKQVYRMTFLLRMPSYRRGDFISYDKSFFYISSIAGNKVHLYDLSSCDEKVLDGKELQKASIFGREDLIKEMILVSQTDQDVQVMDPKAYKIHIIIKPMSVSYKSEKINVVIIEDKLFL